VDVEDGLASWKPVIDMPDSHRPSNASRRRILAVPLAIGSAALLPGCAIPPRLAAVPAARAGEARVLGLPNERFRIATPEGQAEFDREVVAALARQRRALNLPDGAPVPKLDLLAVSGGGEDGAFGAGLLNGWTVHGTRPSFDLVTGVSTGALTAPFAFLGPDWDGPLRDVYTAITPDRVLRRRRITAAIFDDALADTAPLFDTISHYLDERMLAAIAQGHQAGRMLLIGTADIDAQTPVVWNIGAIAASGHPRALDTVRRILLASAAIPGAFPPVLFDVTIDGEPHQEMHVDGGTFAQAFLYPSAVTSARRAAIARRQRVQPARAWIIRNGRLDANWAMVDRRGISIAARAVSSMIAASGFNDAVRLYFFAQRDGIDYNLAFISRDFTQTLASPFEPTYMRALFDFGYDQARAGFEWAKTPPL
jgi:predicted patatin/cPLA2 family phospholipase